MQNCDTSALNGIREFVGEILRHRPTSEDIIEFIDMEDHVVLTLTVKLWKKPKTSKSILKRQKKPIS